MTVALSNYMKGYQMDKPKQTKQQEKAQNKLTLLRDAHGAALADARNADKMDADSYAHAVEAMHEAYRMHSAEIAGADDKMCVQFCGEEVTKETLFGEIKIAA